MVVVRYSVLGVLVVETVVVSPLVVEGPSTKVQYFFSRYFDFGGYISDMPQFISVYVVNRTNLNPYLAFRFSIRMIIWIKLAHVPVVG